MLEITRYLLALIVAATHLWPIGITWAGWQSVFAFYTLSGYLMTRILHERYGFAPAGTLAFLLNRVLRLWPAYLAVVAGTLAALLFLPLQNFFFSLTLPHGLLQEVTTVTILGQVGFDFTYLIPLARPAATSWSLSIELCCYCLLACYFAKTPARLIALAALGAAALVLSTAHCLLSPSPYYGPYCFQNRYGVVQAGFIPFAAGALVYFHRAALRHWLARHWRWLVVAALGSEAMVAADTLASVTIGPFLGVAAMAGLLACNAGDRQPSPAIDFIGRASYHLFIAHISIAAILVTGFAMARDRLPVLLLSLVIALLLSALLVPLEWRLNRLRRRISGNLVVTGGATAPAAQPALPPGPGG